MNGRLCLWLSVSLGVLSLSANSAETDARLASVRSSWNALAATLNASSAGPGWKTYLRWNELGPVVAGKVPPDVNLLADVVTRLDRTAPGLERAEFTRFRRSLDNWTVSLIAQHWGDLPVAIRSQADATPLNSQKLTAAHKTLKSAVARLSTKLGATSRGNAWKKSLRVPELHQALASDQPLEAAKLREHQDRFVGSADGLEWDGFAEVRDALERYAGLAETVGAPDAEKVKGEKLAALADAIAGLGHAPDAAKRAAVDDSLVWLARSEAAPGVVRAVRWRYSQPNLRVQLGADFLNRTVSRPVDEVNPISEFILGAKVRGVGRTIGQLTFNVLPSSDMWMAAFQLSANSFGNTIARKGPARVYGHSTTVLSAQKIVMIDETGIRVLPTTAYAQANPTTDKIKLNVPNIIKPLVRKIAKKQAAESRDEARAIASGIARYRLTDKFDTQFVDPIAEGNQRLHDALLDPLARIDAMPEVDFDSSRRGWGLAALQSRDGQIAATHRPPAPTTPVSLQLHETFVQRVGDLYAGKTLGNVEIEEMVKKRFGKAPDAWSKPAADEEDEDVPGSITFDDQQPLDVAFRDGRITVVLRSKRFTRGERIVDGGMVISTRYAVSTEGRLLVFRREELLAMPAGATPGEKLPLSQTLNKNLVEKGFRKVFPEEIKLDAEKYFDAEARAKYGTAAFAPIYCQDGWISVGMLFANVRG